MLTAENKRLTASLEDYLEAIAELISYNGHAHTKEIAEKLGVKMPSVTGALRQLEKMGYIIYNAHYPVELTHEGARVAREVVRRHSVLKNFFSGILGLSAEKASLTACHLEHVVDGDTIERFVLFSGAIEKRADAGELQVFLTEAMTFMDEEKKAAVLFDLPAGVQTAVLKIGRNLHGDTGIPLAAGDQIEILGFSLDRTSLRIKKGESVLELSRHTAENIWCSEA